jgi:signal transduction histidine kinase
MLSNAVDHGFFFVGQKQRLIDCIIKIFVLPDLSRKRSVPQKIRMNEQHPALQVMGHAILFPAKHLAWGKKPSRRTFALQHAANQDQLILFSIQDITERRSLEQQKDDLISIASHEIRTPVTVIKAYAQILQKRAADINEQFIAITAGKVNEKRIN